MSNVLVTMSDKAAGFVQDLIRLNIDSAEGFTTAAQNIDSPDIDRSSVNTPRNARRMPKS